jgi:pimeloyl-ACP methyl ester carboxylesterase
MKFFLFVSLIFLTLSLACSKKADNNLHIDVGLNKKLELKSGHIKSEGVNLYYVTAGKGPLILLLHGFPEFWFTWRKIIPLLARKFQVVAIDLRGYNKSDSPKGEQNYIMEKLVADVEAVRKFFNKKTLTLIGHDWGGMISWFYSMVHPEQIDAMVVINAPHPFILQKQIIENKKQQDVSRYSINFIINKEFRKEDLLFIYKLIPDESNRKEFIDALNASDINNMIAYYKMNYGRKPYEKSHLNTKPLTLSTTKCPTLMIYGLKDPFILQDSINGNWNMVENTFTLVTIPWTAHFPHLDYPEIVFNNIISWIDVQKLSE